MKKKVHDEQGQKHKQENTNWMIINKNMNSKNKIKSKMAKRTITTKGAPLTLESSSGGMDAVGVALAAAMEVLSSAATPTLSRASNRSSLPTLCISGSC